MASLDDISTPIPDVHDEGAPAAEPQPTVGPFQLSILGGFETDEAAKTFGNRLGVIVGALSKDIDMSTLDGITLAVDYHAALAALDRGREGLQPLAASTADRDGVVGAAMAPSVLREGKVMTHLVFHVGLILGLASDDFESEEWRQALHALAHECAHIEVTAAIDRAFPETILQEPITDHLRGRRLEVISVAWDEYGATRISAGYGGDPTHAYLEIFLKSLASAREAANRSITLYRSHGDVDAVLVEVVTAYGNLIKFSGYLLGTLDGQGKTIGDIPELEGALKDHWFAGHFDRLHETFRGLFERWGSWESRDEFDPIADIFIAVMDEGGFFFRGNADGTMRIDIPFRPENTPYHPILAPFGRG